MANRTVEDIKQKWTDDSGMKKYFVWRGAYRDEMIREHSKTDISVMWSGSVSGAMIPPWSSIRHKVGRWVAHGGLSVTARQVVGSTGEHLQDGLCMHSF